jgi:2-keto-3-deoxygluconate permease
MKLLKGIQKIPGGLMVIPLLIGVLINTFAPKALNIGGFTTALFKNGSAPLIALFMVCCGSGINVRQAGLPIYKGVVLTLAKFIAGATVGWIIWKTFGLAGVLGITPLALIAAWTNSNGGMYVALAGQYGDSSDVGALSILAINDGPFLTMVAFGSTGMANIPIMALVAVIIPLLVGFILGNLDDDFREFLSKGNMLIPFFALPLGAALDLRTVFTAGLSGLLLGLVGTVFTGFICYFATRLYSKKLSVVGAAVGTTAGNAVATPAALAAADPSLTEYVASSTAQIAAAVIITAICVPLLVSFLDKMQKKREGTPAVA